MSGICSGHCKPLFLVFRLVAAQSSVPEREVQVNVIISAPRTRVRIRLPDSVHYLGADRWILYDIADCELHAFVEADARKNNQRLYWIQFEGYVPSKPDLAYTYDSPATSRLVAGTSMSTPGCERKMKGRKCLGSDREHIEALIRSKGYKNALRNDGRSSGPSYSTLQKRKEVMII